MTKSDIHYCTDKV